MMPNPKVQALIDPIVYAIQETSQKQTVTARELLEALAHLIALISSELASRATTLSKLTGEEQTIIALMMQAIKPFFEEKRQNLISKISIEDDDLSKDQVLEKIKYMLYNNKLTPDEGLALVGELVTLATYLRSTTVQNQAQVKKIEEDTLSLIKGKLHLALEAIQVEQGFITKQ